MQKECAQLPESCSAPLLSSLPAGWNKDVSALRPGGQCDNLVRMKPEARSKQGAQHHEMDTPALIPGLRHERKTCFLSKLLLLVSGGAAKPAS